MEECINAVGFAATALYASLVAANFAKPRKVGGIDFIPGIGIATHLNRAPIADRAAPTGYFWGWQTGSLLFGLPMIYSVGHELINYAKNLF